MTRRRRTQVVAIALFGVLLGIVVFVPIPFVIVAPGDAYDLLGESDGSPAVTVDGAALYDTPGSLLLPTTSVTPADSSVHLPGAIMAYFFSDHKVIPRASVDPFNRATTHSVTEDSRQVTTAQRDAVAAALIEAGIPVVLRPLVTQVASNGPAYGKVEVGDLITSVNDVPVQRRAEVSQYVGKVDPGSVIDLGIIRDGHDIHVEVTSVASQDNPSESKIGVEVDTTYQHAVITHVNIDETVIDESGGFAYAIAVYDKVTPGGLVGGRRVAAVGGVTAGGDVWSAQSTRQKVRSAEKAGADVVLVPASSCPDLSEMKVQPILVKVGTFSEAIEDLALLERDPGKVPTC